MEMTYEEFINNILETRGRNGCGEEYHETHHIIPKCMGGSNDKENLIDLFAREHFEAHRLLALENPENRSLVYAWNMMCNSKNGNYQITADEYEEARIVFSQMMKDQIVSDETRKKLSESLTGHVVSDETKEKISAKAKDRMKDKNNNPFYGKHHTEETKEKIRKARENMPNEIKQKYSKAQKKRFENTEVKEFYSNIAKERFLNSENHPMYGRHHSEETKKKISKANKGRVPPNKGKPMSEEQKQKLRRPKTDEEKRKNSDSHKGLQIGANNPNAKYVIQFDKMNSVIKVWRYLKLASSELNIQRTDISSCCSGRLKTAGGYQWKYLYDQTRKDGTVIPGAISLGLITEEEALKQLAEQENLEGEN